MHSEFRSRDGEGYSFLLSQLAMVRSLALMTNSPLAGTSFSFLAISMLVLLGSRSGGSVRVYLLD